MVPSLSVHVAAASVKATVRCPHWAACLAKKASLSRDGQRNVCSGRRLKPKIVGSAAHPFGKPEMKVRAE